MRMKVVKPVEFKCGRSWVFTCEPANTIPFFELKDGRKEWTDKDGIFASPKIGLLGNDVTKAVLACLRWATR